MSQASVDRLSMAMEAAEEELEAAAKRSGDIYKSNAVKKEQELLDLRRLLAEKERAVDSLRESLTSTKRELGTKLIQAETQVPPPPPFPILFLPQYPPRGRSPPLSLHAFLPILKGEVHCGL